MRQTIEGTSVTQRRWWLGVFKNFFTFQMTYMCYFNNIPRVLLRIYTKPLLQFLLHQFQIFIVFCSDFHLYSIIMNCLLYFIWDVSLYKAMNKHNIWSFLLKIISICTGLFNLRHTLHILSENQQKFTLFDLQFTSISGYWLLSLEKVKKNRTITSPLSILILFPMSPGISQ